jgi:hypothetical protein
MNQQLQQGQPACAQPRGQQHQRRRALLAGAAALLCGLPAVAAEVDALPPASSDLIEGSQRLSDLGRKALELQLQQAAGGLGGGLADDGDQTADLRERKRRFGEFLGELMRGWCDAKSWPCSAPW